MSSFTAVVVLHNSEPHLAALLDSLDRHLPGQAQLVVVDTGSDDAGPERARRRGAQVIELPENRGFGHANNAGIEHAEHDVTVLLNPDTILLGDGLTHLVSEARRRDVLLFPRLLRPDGTIEPSAHPEPGTAREIARALLPRTALTHRSDRPARVGWAIAAVLVARTRTLRALGPFDPEAFLFYEDMDLCLRAPVPSVLRPEVQVLHTGGHSTGARRLEDEARRRRAVVEQRRGRRARQRDDLAQLLTFARAAAFKRRPREQLRALWVARTP